MRCRRTVSGGDWYPRYSCGDKVCMRCMYVYQRVSRRMEPTRRSGYLPSASLHHPPHPNNRTTHTKLRIPPRVVSISTATLPACYSVRYSGRATPLLPFVRHREAHRALPVAVDSQNRRRALWRPWVAGCLGSAPHRLHCGFALELDLRPDDIVPEALTT